MNEVIRNSTSLGDDIPPRILFDTVEQLLAVPFVKRWADDADFSWLAIDKQPATDRYYLMAIERGGRKWWVIGRLLNPVEGLRQWDGGIYEAFDEDGKPIEIPGSEVYSSCGDDLTLKNGRRLKLQNR